MAKVEKAKQLVHELYQYHGSVGCCLHIVTDDGNIEDNHVDFCVKYAIDKKHKFCQDLAELFKSMSKHERALTLNMWWCPSCKDYTLYEYCGMNGCETKAKKLPEDEREMFALIVGEP